MLCFFFCNFSKKINSNVHSEPTVRTFDFKTWSFESSLWLLTHIVYITKVLKSSYEYQKVTFHYCVHCLVVLFNLLFLFQHFYFKSSTAIAGSLPEQDKNEEGETNFQRMRW